MSGTPSSRRPVVAVLVIGLLVAGGLGAYLAWDQFLRGDQVDPLDFASPSPSAVDPAPSASPSVSAAPSAAASAAPSASTGSGVGAADALAGEWTSSDGSVVGYRVRERLAFLEADSDAVGRTTAVTGSATVVADGDAIRVTAAAFEADVSQLESDDGRRDNRIRSIGLQSDQFPTATFTLSAPADVPAEALSGVTVGVTLSGELTIHGVTKSVAIPAEARLVDGRIEVLGSLTFPFSDFGMEPPNVAGFVTVEDDATLEFLVVLAAA